VASGFADYLCGEKPALLGLAAADRGADALPAIGWSGP